MVGIASFILTLSFGACAKQSKQVLLEEESSDLSREEFMKSSLQFETYTRDQLRALNGDGIGITFTFARPKYDCLKGFGLCISKTRLLPEGDGADEPMMLPSASEEEQVLYAPLNLRGSNPSLDLFLKEKPSTFFTEEDLLLEIDEDIVFPSKGSPLGKSYKIKAGKYKFDPSLGHSGGYSIPFTPCVD